MYSVACTAHHPPQLTPFLTDISVLKIHMYRGVCASDERLCSRFLLNYLVHSVYRCTRTGIL